MNKYFLSIILLINIHLTHAQGFKVACGQDTIRGNHGESESDKNITFCAYHLSESNLGIPNRLLTINDSIVNSKLKPFFEDNDVTIRDYIWMENERFDSIKANGHGWISKKLCDPKVKYAIRYQITIYDHIKYFFSLNYDSTFNCLNLASVSTLSKHFNKRKLMDFCSMKKNADKDLHYLGNVTEATFFFKDNRCVWIFEKEGPPHNKKTLKGYDYILTYDAYSGKLIKRSKQHYQACQPCPSNFW